MGMRDCYDPALTAPLHGTWTTRAACVGYSWLLESDQPGDIHAARALCATCPVIGDCTRWVMSLQPREDPGGVVAGMTAFERSRARNSRRGFKSQATIRAKKEAS